MKAFLYRYDKNLDRRELIETFFVASAIKYDTFMVIAKTKLKEYGPGYYSVRAGLTIDFNVDVTA